MHVLFVLFFKAHEDKYATLVRVSKRAKKAALTTVHKLGHTAPRHTAPRHTAPKHTAPRHTASRHAALRTADALNAVALPGPLK